MTFIRLAMASLSLALGAMIAAPAFAILPADPAGAEAAEGGATEAVISQAQDAGDDDRIAARISGIFSELPGFEGVEIEVNEGVVTLTGALPNPEMVERAEGIAGRVSGVVTVQNNIERDLSVEQNLSVIGKGSELASTAVAALPLLVISALVALVIAALGYLIAGLGWLWNRIAPNAFLAELIASAIRFVSVVGGVVIALDMLGAGALLGAVLGGAGVIGIALGFAMRETIENYVASLMLSLRQPFRPNDHVLIDDLEGRVIRLTSRATILMTLEGNHLRVPNSQVFKAVIVNFTTNPQRRFDFELGIDADDDPRAAMKVGTDDLRERSFVLDDPAPAARITNVGDSNIAIQFLGWIDQNEADWYKSRSLAIASVKDALENAGFALPEPIYRLRFDGRTDPLPIGRSAQIKETTPAPDKTASKMPINKQPAEADDVRPESEISELVEAERQSGGDQSNDLLDEGRPVE